jgi:hypothetical protein
MEGFDDCLCHSNALNHCPPSSGFASSSSNGMLKISLLQELNKLIKKNSIYCLSSNSSWLLSWEVKIEESREI